MQDGLGREYGPLHDEVAPSQPEGSCDGRSSFRRPRHHQGHLCRRGYRFHWSIIPSQESLPIAAGRTGGLARARSITEEALRAYAEDFRMHTKVPRADPPTSMHTQEASRRYQQGRVHHINVGGPRSSAGRTRRGDPRVSVAERETQVDYTACWMTTGRRFIELRRDAGTLVPSL